jgi:hypothetical protein
MLNSNILSGLDQGNISREIDRAGPGVQGGVDAVVMYVLGRWRQWAREGEVGKLKDGSDIISLFALG